MDLKLGDPDVARDHMINKFRQKKIFSLLNAEQQKLVIEDMNTIQYKILEAIGSRYSVQDIKIRIIEHTGL